MRETIIGVAALAAGLLLAAAYGSQDVKPCDCITGSSPSEVASAIKQMKAEIAPEKRQKFGQAINTLTLVMPDRTDSRTVDNMSPQFAQMVKGRSADQIIQLADLYRLSVPMDRP